MAESTVVKGADAKLRVLRNIFDEIYFKYGHILAKKYLTKYLHACIILPVSREVNISKWTWWNGIHSGLKIRRRKAWGFKSPRPHQSVVINRFFLLMLFGCSFVRISSTQGCIHPPEYS